MIPLYKSVLLYYNKTKHIFHFTPETIHFTKKNRTFEVLFLFIVCYNVQTDRKRKDR